jgi:hypothetical protein
MLNVSEERGSTGKRLLELRVQGLGLGFRESTGKSLLELPKTRTTLMRRKEKLPFLNFPKWQTHDDLEQFSILCQRDATRTVSTYLYARTIVVNTHTHTHISTHT